MKKLCEATQHYNDTIRPLIEQADGRNVIASVSYVSRSGITRWIEVFIDNGECYTTAYPYIAETLGVSMSHEYGKRGVRVVGYGMDMIFDTLYRYYQAIGIPQPIALELANNYKHSI